MLEITDFPGKTQHFNIAAEIGMKLNVIGTALLIDERGIIVPAHESQLRLRVQGKRLLTAHGEGCLVC